MMQDDKLRSPLGRAKGTGAAKEGVGHWWAQRITAVALVVLLLWFIASIVSLAGADRAAITAWLHAPLPAILMVLLLIAGFYHTALGIEVVVEDYVHSECIKIPVLVLTNLVCFALAVAGIFAVLRMALGG